MRVKRVYAENIRRIDKIELDLENKNIFSLVGKNGTGKSTIAKVIEYNLFGKDDELKGLLDKDIYTENSYDINGKELNIIRSKKSLEVNGEQGRKKELQEEIEKILGFDYDYFINAVYFEQRNFDSFIKMKATEKKEKMREWFDLLFWDEINKKVKEKVKDYRTENRELYLKGESLEERIQEEKTELEEFDFTDKQIEEKIKDNEKIISEINKIIRKNEKIEKENLKIGKENKEIEKIERKKESELSEIKNNLNNLKQNQEKNFLTVKKYQNKVCPKCGYNVYGKLIEDSKKDNIKIAAEIGKLKNKKESLIKEIEELNKGYKEVKEIEDYDPYEKEEAKESIIELKNISKNIQKIKDKINKLKKELTNTKKKETKIENKIKILDIIQEATSKNGVPNFLLGEYLEKLNIYINEKLADLSEDFDMEEIEITNEGRTKTGKVTQGFEILVKVKDEKEPRKIETFSGGELTVIVVAFRLGLIEIISEIIGNKTNFTIFDELFAALDKDNREIACKLLNSLSEEFEQIMMISHTGISEILPNIIKLERKGKFTRVVV